MARVFVTAAQIAVATLVCNLAAEAWAALTLSSRSTALGSTVVGDVLETTTPADHKVRDVSALLTLIRPSRLPIDTILRRADVRRGSSMATAQKVEWEEDEAIPRESQTAEAEVTPANPITITMDHSDGRFRVDDLWYWPDNTVTAAGTITQVTVVSGADVTFRAVGESAYGTFGCSDNEKCYRLSRGRPEKSTAGASLTTMPAQLYNYTHIFETVVGISGTRLATRNYTMNDAERMEMQALYDFRRDLERNLIFGGRSLIGSYTYHGGLLQYVSTNDYNYTTGSLTESNLIDMMKQAFTGNSGSALRILFTTPTLTAEIDKILIASGTLQSTRSENVLGVEATRIHSSFGDVMLINHQELEEMGKTNWGVWIDPANVRRKPLRPMKTKDVTANNVDGTDTQWLEECSLEVRYEVTHGVIRDTATDSYK